MNDSTPTDADFHQNFPATRWSLVLHAQVGGSVEQRRALEELCHAYWFPLYAFIRKSGFSREDSEDLVQEFLNHVLQHSLLRDVAVENGKLRSWLLALLKPFLVDYRRKAGAKKRGGGARIISIDAADTEACYTELHDEATTPDAAFEKRWAISVFGAALDAVDADYRQRGKGVVFEELCPHLQWQGDGETSYSDSAARLGITEGSVKVAVYRLRKRFGEALRNEVMHTLGPKEDVEAEMRYLLKVASC